LCFEIDISVHLGARSIEGTKYWVTSEQNAILHPNIKLSRPDICEQLYLPLTYDDGINVRQTTCTNMEAHVACAVRCEYVLF